MRKIGVLAKGREPDAEEYETAQMALNSLVAEYQTYGLPLWKRSQLNLVTIPNQKSYLFHNTNTTINGIYWLGGITWAGGILWAGQTTGSSLNDIPNKIESIVIRDIHGSAQEVQDCSRTEFNLLNTTSVGKPVQYTYQPFINSGELLIWPKPDKAYTLEITYYPQQYGFGTGADTPDFPQEWQNALVFGLASLLGPEYGIPISDRQYIDKQAEKHLDIAKDFQFENTSIFFQIERRP
ncbi:MAG: hypothetical protein ACRCVT_06470 [Leadbetterella sp.]